MAYKRALKSISCLIATLLLACALFSCSGKSGNGAYFVSRSSRKALSGALSVPLGGNRFESFLNRGYIKVSSGTGESLRYGVLDKDGQAVLPLEYTSVSMDGDFFLVQGSLYDSLYAVLNRQGEKIYGSNEMLNISDAGGGYVRIVQSGEALLYGSNGQNVLPGTSLDDSYEYSVCEHYVIARSESKHNAFVFSARSSEILLCFYGNSSTDYEVAYLGGKRFAVLQSKAVSESAKHKIAIGGYYLDQTVYLYTIGESLPRTFALDKVLVTVRDRYAVGVSEEARENYPLSAGYYCVSYYNEVNGVADGTLSSYIADSSLKEIKAVPAGIGYVLSMTDGMTAEIEPSTGAICLINDKLELVKKINDAIYQDLVFSGDILTTSKVVSGARRIGGYDLSGNQVIPFLYTYISEFYGDKAVAVRDHKAYILDKSGKEEYVAERDLPYSWEGFYEYQEGEKMGLKSFDGQTLLAALFDSLVGEKRVGEETFVALLRDGVYEVYRLF